MGSPENRDVAPLLRLAPRVIGYSSSAWSPATISRLSTHATFFSISGMVRWRQPPDTDMGNHILRKRVISWLRNSQPALLSRQETQDASSPFAAPPDGCRLSLVWTLAVASADEYHQSFCPHRTGVPQDVLLDIAGGALFLLLLQLWLLLGPTTRRSSLRPRNRTKEGKMRNFTGFPAFSLGLWLVAPFSPPSYFLCHPRVGAAAGLRAIRPHRRPRATMRPYQPQDQTDQRYPVRRSRPAGKLHQPNAARNRHHTHRNNAQSGLKLDRHRPTAAECPTTAAFIRSKRPGLSAA